MNCDSDPQSNMARMNASLADIHILISALEAQLKLGLSPDRLEVRAVEDSMPKSFS
jgi:hypothetical protein